MPAAPTVVGGSFVKPSVIVVKNKVLTLKANYVRDASEVSIVFSNYEGTRIESEYHACCIDETTLIIIGAGVLLCGDCNVWGVLTLPVLYAIGATDENCIVVKSHSVAIAMALRDCKEIRKSAIYGIEEISPRHCPREDRDALWRGGEYRKAISGNLLGARY